MKWSIRKHSGYTLLKGTLFCVVLFYSNYLHAFTYYVSRNGSDSNDGRSTQTPWKSLDKVNTFTFSPGDSILFKRGDSWFGQLVIKQFGTKAKMITYGSFGHGPLPVLSGTNEISGWKHYKNGIYVVPVKSFTGMFFVNGHAQQKARFPNKGFLTTGNNNTLNLLNDSTLIQTKGYWTGATARIRTIDWAYESRKITSSNPGILNYATSTRYLVKKGFGYYIDNTLKALDQPGEWYYDPSKKLLYFYPPKGINPNNLKTEASIFSVGVSLAFNSRFLQIENISFTRYYQYGLYGKSVQYISVANCEFSYIQECGIQIDPPESSRLTIENNRFKHILGRGISLLAPTASVVKNNSVESIGLLPGYGVDCVNNAIAIVFEGGGGNEVAWNTVDSTGYVGIRVDGTSNLIEYNLVKNTMLHYKDGAAIYCFGVNDTYTFNSIIRNNIVINAVGSEEATPHKDPITQGIYLDNRVHQITVENNLIIDAKGSGILINDQVYNNTIKGNTTFNCGTGGIGFAEWATIGGIHSNKIINNLFINRQPSQYPVTFLNYLADNLKAGTFENNILVSPAEKVVRQFLKVNGAMNERLLTLSEWEKELTNKGNLYINSGLQTEVLYNASKETKELPVPGGKAVDISGNTLDKMVVLKPFQWIVIFKKA